jgi:hypothetical protein
VFQGLTKWLNSNVKTLKKKAHKEAIKNAEGTIVMANTKGQLQEFKVPADIKHLMDQKKMHKRAVNITMMQRPPQKVLYQGLP